ncbi:hypothetical protein CRENBAI_011550 [Crenichthys baileyi]|uniref:Uncharacterized protein n=1 Tax=Crenichthys baileyi TaxID=28760 RepID=A0AAV9SKV0_9TELE
MLLKYVRARPDAFRGRVLLRAYMLTPLLMPACFCFVPASSENPADKQKADALDRWVEHQKEEAMRNLPNRPRGCCLTTAAGTDGAGRQTRARVRRGCSVPPPQLRTFPPSASVPAAKPSSSSRRRNRRRAGVNSRWLGEEGGLPAS